MARDNSFDVAVTGMAARFPGASDLGSWWEALLAGRVLPTRYSREQLQAAGVQAELMDEVDYVPVHGHLEGAECFDNAFFGISPREATLMDPQHRLALAVAWQALEDAGVPASHDRRRTAVFASSTGSGYLHAVLANGPVDPGTLDDLIHGTETDFMASRISYKFGLTGPALAVQTACSSSLVGVHLAVQALLSGDCDQALVVASGMAFPQAGYLHLPGGILSASGRIRPFDAGADGVVGGSGVACVVLRRLEDALADGTSLRGVVLGTAINNDGAGRAGYYAPSAAGQEAAIREALAAAEVDGSSIGYLETHGTGTPIGDPVEWSAASSALAAAGALPGQVVVGAVKANVGHLDACAGLAGWIKALLVVDSGQVPPVAGFSELNPLLETTGSPLVVPSVAGPWLGPEPPRASVSAFGIGGTNAHVIVEQAPVLAHRQPDEQGEVGEEGDARNVDERPVVLALSAADDQALGRIADALADHLEAGLASLTDVAHTLVRGRAELPHRLTITARSAEEAAVELRVRGRAGAGIVPDTGVRPLVFVFPGQGSQTPGMGLPYAAILPGFRDALEDVVRHLEPSLRGRVRGAVLDSSFPALDLDQTALAQPSLLCLQLANAAALADLGVAPDAVVGHSLGEVAAACVAAIMSPEDALAFVVARGQAMQDCPPGRLLALGCDEERVLELIECTSLDLASVNAAESCVVAGRAEEVASLASRLEPSMFARKLRTTRAFHSRLMHDSIAPLEATVASMTMSPSAVLFADASDGQLFGVGDTTPHELWTLQVRRPVRFGAAVRALGERLGGPNALEIGPGRALAAAVEEAGIPTVALGPGGPGMSSANRSEVLDGLGALWALGYGPDLARLTPGAPVRLPSYPFAGPLWSAAQTKAPAAAPAPSALSGRPPIAAEDQTDIESESAVDLGHVVAAAWTSLLGVDGLTDDSDFFALGGDSLLITRLARQLNGELGIRVPVRDMLAGRTLGRQVEVVAAEVEGLEATRSR